MSIEYPNEKEAKYFAEQEQKIKSIVLKHFPEESVRVFLFGSRADGSASFNSDFDVGLMDQDLSPVDEDKYLQAKSEIDDEILVEVDLVDFARKSY